MKIIDKDIIPFTHDFTTEQQNIHRIIYDNAVEMLCRKEFSNVVIQGISEVRSKDFGQPSSVIVTYKDDNGIHKVKKSLSAYWRNDYIKNANVSQQGDLGIAISESDDNYRIVRQNYATNTMIIRSVLSGNEVTVPLSYRHLFKNSTDNINTFSNLIIRNNGTVSY